MDATSGVATISVCLGVSLDFENANSSLSSWYIYFKRSDSKLVLLNLKYTKSSTVGYDAQLQPTSATMMVSHAFNLNAASTTDQLMFPHFGPHSTNW